MLDRPPWPLWGAGQVNSWGNRDYQLHITDFIAAILTVTQKNVELKRVPKVELPYSERGLKRRH